jgi:hypothetical protein
LAAERAGAADLRHDRGRSSPLHQAGGPAPGHPISQQLGGIAPDRLVQGLANFPPRESDVRQHAVVEAHEDCGVVAVPKGGREPAQARHHRRGGGKDHPAERFGGALTSLGMGRHGTLHIFQGRVWAASDLRSEPPLNPPVFANGGTFAEAY